MSKFSVAKEFIGPLQTVAVVKTFKGNRTTRKVYPNSKVVDFVYNTTLTLLTGSIPNVLGNEAAYRLNKPNLPLVGQVTGQMLPQGFKEMAAVYKNYKVLGTKVKLTFTPARGQEISTVAIWPTPNSEPDTLTGKGLSIIDMKQGVYTKPLGSEGKPFVWKRNFNISTMESVDRKAYLADFYQYEGAMIAAIGAAGSAGPFRMPLIHIAGTNNLTTANNSIIVDVEIIYKCKLYGRVALTSSTSSA